MCFLRSLESFALKRFAFSINYQVCVDRKLLGTTHIAELVDSSLQYIRNTRTPTCKTCLGNNTESMEKLSRGGTPNMELEVVLGVVFWVFCICGCIRGFVLGVLYLGFY